MRWPPSSLVVLRIEDPMKIVEIVVSGALGGGQGQEKLVS